MESQFLLTQIAPNPESLLPPSPLAANLFRESEKRGMLAPSAPISRRAAIKLVADSVEG
jgi:hypothetical protein